MHSSGVTRRCSLPMRALQFELPARAFERRRRWRRAPACRWRRSRSRAATSASMSSKAARLSRRQRQQLRRRVARGARVAGRQEGQAPAPLQRIELRPQLERGGGRQQQLGQLLPDRRIGQRLHVGIAQLRAVAAARAGARRGAVDHAHLDGPARFSCQAVARPTMPAPSTHTCMTLLPVAACWNAPTLGAPPAPGNAKSARGP